MIIQYRLLLVTHHTTPRHTAAPVENNIDCSTEGYKLVNMESHQFALVPYQLFVVNTGIVPVNIAVVEVPA